jgi:hypothetical protein
MRKVQRGAAALEAGSDAQLCWLGEKVATIEAWFDAQETADRPDTDDDPEYTEKMDQQCELIEQIAGLQAKTLSGQQVKAACLIYYFKGIGFRPDEPHEQIALSLARDLLVKAA